MPVELVIDREGQPAGAGLIRVKEDGKELMTIRFNDMEVFVTGQFLTEGQRWLSSKKGNK